MLTVYDTVNYSGTLQNILSADRLAHCSLAVPYALGDSYLFNRNRIYRNLRIQLKDAGFRIEKDNGRYFVFGLILLNEMIDQKVIYSLDNVWAVEKLESMRPDFFSAKHVFAMGLRGNYMSHESSHLLSEIVWRQYSATTEMQSHQAQVMRHLLSEAFANTVDSLLYLESRGDALGELFLAFNSYYGRVHRKEVAEAMAEISNQVGFGKLVQVLVLSYLIANFGYYRATRFHLDGILSLLNISSLRHAVKPIFEDAMGLNKVFVAITNQVYLNAAGFDGDIQQITDFNPFDFLESHDSMWQIFSDLTDLVSRLPPPQTARIEEESSSAR